MTCITLPFCYSKWSFHLSRGSVQGSGYRRHRTYYFWSSLQLLPPCYIEYRTRSGTRRSLVSPPGSAVRDIGNTCTMDSNQGNETSCPLPRSTPRPVHRISQTISPRRLF